MSEAPYISLADYAATVARRGEAVTPEYVHPTGPPVHLTEGSGLAERLEEVLDTVVALQRADWLQDGVYLGPRAMGPVYRDLLECARTLGVAVPPAVVAGCSMSAQGTFGTNDRAFLLLSSFFLKGADEAERRFLLGRLCGHIHARQATWSTLYALLVDHNGIRQVGRRYLGPTLEVVLAPMSLGARLALSRWHRAAEITADRAGLITSGTLDGARRALLRLALGVRPEVDPTDYLDTLRGVRSDDSPARWTELLASQPWMHKRMQALELFTRSETWVQLGGAPHPDPISRERLDQLTEALLRVR